MSSRHWITFYIIWLRPVEWNEWSNSRLFGQFVITYKVLELVIPQNCNQIVTIVIFCNYLSEQSSMISKRHPTSTYSNYSFLSEFSSKIRVSHLWDGFTCQNEKFLWQWPDLVYMVRRSVCREFEVQNLIICGDIGLANQSADNSLVTLIILCHFCP